MATVPGKNRPTKPKGESTVADDAPLAPNPFSVSTVEALVALMREHDLSEIDRRSATQRIRLRRGARVQAAPAPLVAMPAPAVAAPSATPAAPKTDATPAKKLVEIKSPTPGTFYGAPNPDSQPFVRVGSRVTPESVVCVIEAMKIFNEIAAECTGVIAEILAENQQPVEYGQVLFRVDPAG